MEPRADPDPRLRAADHPRHRRRGRRRIATLRRARRLGGRHRGCRAVGGALRDHRWSPLPRGDRLAAVLRSGRLRRHRRAAHLGRRLGHLGRGLARCARCVDRGTSPRCRAATHRRCHRPGHCARSGDRTLGQLVQPGTLRGPHLSAVGPADRPAAPARRIRGVRDVPPHVSLRVALDARCCTGPHLGRQALHDGAWPGVRALRPALLPGSWVDRIPADRHGQHHPGRAPQCLDLDPGGPRCPRLPHRVGAPAARTRGGDAAAQVRRA